MSKHRYSSAYQDSEPKQKETSLSRLIHYHFKYAVIIYDMQQ